jgi:uncharacterized membrane protein SirB2
VVLSIGLFVLRGVLMLVESPHVQSAWLRYPSYAIDTLLLTAALMLTSVVHQYPFGNGWLTMKVALLVVYVVLGSVALKRGRTRRIRIAAFAAALLTVGFLVTVARAHHPLGIFASLAA